MRPIQIYSKLFAIVLIAASCSAEDDFDDFGEREASGTPVGALRVTEVSSSSRAANFVEVQNVARDQVDLAGWKVSVGRRSLGLEPVAGHPTTVEPGQLALLVDSGFDVATMRAPSWLPIMTAEGLDQRLANYTSIALVDSAKKKSDAVNTDEVDASPRDGDSLERLENGRFMPSTLGPSPGARNARHDQQAIQVFFATPPGDETDPVAPQLINVINGAKKSLDCAFYQLNNGDIIDAFVAAKARGVEVRFVTDTDWYTNPKYTEGYQRMESAGITVVQDQRGALMHSKFMVVDHEWVWTGSYNLIVPTHNRFDHADNALVFHSPLLASIHTAQFEQMFAQKFGPRKQDLGQHVAYVDGVRVEAYFAPTDNLQSHVSAVLDAAESSIHFLTFSFYLPELAQQLVQLSAKHVDIRGVFDKTSTSEKSEYPTLINAGLDVRYPETYLFLHDKYFAIDHAGRLPVVVTGSPNFSESAYNKNDEAMYVIYDREIAVAYDKNYETVYAGSVGQNKSATTN